ncbi:hypothetical protein CHS0354_030303, partial [Potamilus streckersoni]
MGNYVSAVDHSEGLHKFQESYRPIHGYLAAIVCVFGVIANILNIIILTRKNMISSTNIILTGLAISDGLTMALYFPYALQMYVIYGTAAHPQRDTLGCARFQMAYAILSVILHSISIWLTVTLAVFRYVFIRFPRRGAKLCSVKRAKLSVIIVSVVVTIVCIPNSVNYSIYSDTMSALKNDTTKVNGTIFWIDVKNNYFWEQVMKKCNFWIQATLVKIIPCVLLTIFSFLLVRTMRGAERRRKLLMNQTSCTPNNGETQPIGNGSKRSKRSIRTTRMLLTVVILFLITEIPQGVMHVLSDLIENFFHKVYTPLGDLMDILTLINNGINFVLYCTMSKQFRDTFLMMFCSCFPKLVDRRKLTN